MTDTVNSANAAASTLFLGHNGDWWDFWLIVSGICVAIAATAVGVTTTGSLVAHKREAVAAEQELAKYKLDTAKEIAEADARTAQAKVELDDFRWQSGPRIIDSGKFLSSLKGSPVGSVEIEYLADDFNSIMVAEQLKSILETAGWTITALNPITIAALVKKAVGGFPVGLELWSCCISHEESHSAMELMAGRIPSVKTPYVFLSAAILEALPRAGTSVVDPSLPKDHFRLTVFPR
ncbi:MAG TPA: hypothetical protein VE999_07665 [Gemmataceae bacterium]|nr:hypothetical protein [Gemmataceae bacterium]